MLLRSALLGALLLLSACGNGKPCEFYGNCACDDWYNNCSLH